MKVLLVNPNRYQHPPVPPIGLEYIAGVLEAAGDETEIADLCFSGDPLKDLDTAITSFKPDAVGITVRNVDTVLYQANEFFLAEIKALITHIRERYGLKVLVGGAGASAGPEFVRDFLGADSIISGPGEGVVSEVFGGFFSNKTDKVHFGSRAVASVCPRRSTGIDYQKYAQEGGMAGFETHRGCSSSCIYCIEADTRVSFRKIPEVLSGIRELAAGGLDRFHLCDPEFNEDLDFSLDFLRALKESRIKIDWAVYMKPANQNRRLFQLMKETGVSLITLTVDSWKKCPLYWTEIEKIVFSARSNGIKIVVDFLTGFPYEDDETLNFYLDLFRRLRPDSVGINTYIRLYANLKVTEIIMKDAALKASLIGAVEDRTFLRPVFYNRIEPERLSGLLGIDPLFRIEGLDKAVNYTRIAST
ncbi:MAG: B12-binding domain-containing radical SAM protein [Thermodesulfovibrionales bacterium]